MKKPDPKRVAQGRRLRQARIEAEYRSARAAAEDNQWPESTYRAHEAGTRTIGDDDAERYARVFRAKGAAVTGRDIIYPPEVSAPAQIANGLIRAPIISWVSAGKLADPSEPTPTSSAKHMIVSGLGNGDFFALTVDGSSMDRYSPHGSIIIVDRSERTLINGKSYVFAVKGATTYKMWNAEFGYPEPHSWDGSHKPIRVKRSEDLEVVGRVKRTVLDL